jgi:predicted small metal-binding protein
MKEFSCGDVVPGWTMSFSAASEAELLEAVAAHARGDHGLGRGRRPGLEHGPLGLAGAEQHQVLEAGVAGAGPASGGPAKRERAS